MSFSKGTLLLIPLLLFTSPAFSHWKVMRDVDPDTNTEIVYAAVKDPTRNKAMFVLATNDGDLVLGSFRVLSLQEPIKPGMKSIRIRVDQNEAYELKITRYTPEYVFFKVPHSLVNELAAGRHVHVSYRGTTGNVIPLKFSLEHSRRVISEALPGFQLEPVHRPDHDHEPPANTRSGGYTGGKSSPR